MQSYISKISKLDLSKIPLSRTFGYFYGGVTILGLFYGALQGCYVWRDWLSTRSQISIGSKTYDPLINNIRDIGQWGFYVLQSGTGSALLVATSPISVPLLLRYKGVAVSEKPHDQQK